MRDLVEETEVCAEDISDCKNGQNRNQGRQLRNGDVANALPLRRTIHGRCFIVSWVNSHDGCIVHDTAITKAFPDS